MSMIKSLSGTYTAMSVHPLNTKASSHQAPPTIAYYPGHSRTQVGKAMHFSTRRKALHTQRQNRAQSSIR